MPNTSTGQAKLLPANQTPKPEDNPANISHLTSSQRPNLRRRRGRGRGKAVPSPGSGQGIDAFTSAQDVSIVESTINFTTVHHHGPEKLERPSSWAYQSISNDQSPPIPDSSSSRIYYEQLLTKLRGVPLWLPGPNINLPIDYRLRGAHIGDVGTITEFGGFSFLFNIFEDAESEINQGSVPEGFKPLRWISNSAYVKGKGTGNLGVRRTDVEKHTVYESGSWVGSKTVEEVDPLSFGGLTFQTRALEGAILTMPYGATSHDLTNRKLLQEYMSQNLEQWYIYANRERGRQARNGDIRLVYGCDKAPFWGIATFKYDHDTFNPSDSDVARRIHFKPSSSGNATVFAWSSMGGESGRAGPSFKEMKGLHSHLVLHDEAARHPVYGYEDGLIENQCVFLRTLNAKLATGTWMKLMSDGIDSPWDETSGSQFGDGHDSGSGDAQQGGASGGSSNFETSSRSCSSSWGSNIQYATMEGQPLPLMHPSEALNCSLLIQFPHAKMAITADADWLSVLSQGDASKTTSLLKLGLHRLHFERLMHRSHHIIEVDGVILIEERVTTSPAISPHRRERSTFTSTLKRHPEFYTRDGDLRFVAGSTVLKIKKKTVPKSVRQLLSFKPRRSSAWGSGVAPVMEEMLALLVGCMPSTPRMELEFPGVNEGKALDDASKSAESSSSLTPFINPEKERPVFSVGLPLLTERGFSTKLKRVPFKPPASAVNSAPQVPFLRSFSALPRTAVPLENSLEDDARSITSSNSPQSFMSGGTGSTKATSVSSHPSDSWRSSAKSENWRSSKPQDVKALPYPYNVKVMDGTPWELDSLPRQQHPDVSSNPNLRNRKPKVPRMNSISEQLAISTSSRSFRVPKLNSTEKVTRDGGTGTRDIAGAVKESSLKDEVSEPVVKKVQRGQVNALTKC